LELGRVAGEEIVVRLARGTAIPLAGIRTVVAIGVLEAAVLGGVPQRALRLPGTAVAEPELAHLGLVPVVRRIGLGGQDGGIAVTGAQGQALEAVVIGTRHGETG